jgi:hypothetical protein
LIKIWLDVDEKYFWQTFNDKCNYQLEEMLIAAYPNQT